MRLWLLLLLASLGTAEAATITAASASEADVAIAYAATADGDILDIPAGTASVTNTLVVTKAITIQGAGIGQTIWLDDIVETGTDASEAIVVLDTTIGKSYRLTGIEFRIGARTTSYFSGAVQTSGESVSIRIDHCRFDRLKNAGIRVGDSTLGCVDNNQWYNTTKHTIITRNHELYSSTLGYGSWETAIVPGSDQAWYYEDNIFTGDDSDCFGGGRAVWRFNTFTNSLIHTHGTESSGQYRACRWHEVYGNTYYKTIVDSREFLDWRDGSGLVASNTIVLQGAGTASTMFSVNNYRMWGPYNYWGGADGTNPLDINDTVGGIFETGVVAIGSSGSGDALRTITDTNKNWTINQWRGYTLRNMSSNYAAPKPYGSNYFSQISASTSNTITYKEHALSTVMRFATGNLYEIRRVLRSLDMPGSGASDPFAPASVPPLPNQTYLTIYQWSNTNGGATVLLDPGSQTHIVDGREYSNNVAHPTWIPYTYPHPLRNEGPLPSPPTAPTNLVAVTASSTSIDLSWTNTDGTNVVSVLIEQSPVDNLNFATIYSVSGSVSNYTSAGLTPSTTYYYRVRASNTGGLSAYSNETNATTSASSSGNSLRSFIQRLFGG